MRIGLRLPSRLSLLHKLSLLNGLLLLLLALAIHMTPAPVIQTTLGGATVDIRADRAWVLLPRQCAQISWKLEETLSLSIDGNEKAGYGDMIFCPTLNATRLNFEIAAANGEARAYDLNIQDLPAAAVTCLIILALLLPALIAVYYVATMRLAAPAPINLRLVLGLGALLLALLLVQSARPFTIDDVLYRLRDVFTSPHWLAFGWVSAGLVFLPLVFQSLRRGRQPWLREEFVVGAAFLALLLLLYLPFGFDFVWQYEEWANQALFEGRPSKVANEAITRFWVLFQHPLATVTSVNPVIFHHLFHIAVATCKLLLLYGIARKFGVAPLYAFLFTALAMVYPVNAYLMSSRSVLIAFSVSALFAAAYLTLHFVEKPSRLRLTGIFLALFFNVGSYEIAFAIIALAPILWWWRRPRWTWRNVNLTAIWYLVPAAKLIYIALLANSNVKFYGAQLISEARGLERTALESISTYLDVVANTYFQTFARGWNEALASLQHNEWIVPTLAALLIAGVVATYLAKDSKASDFPSRRQAIVALLGGLLFILPSIAVLIFFERYQYELWRPYVYVPVGAAAVVISLLLLLVSPVKNFRLRQVVVVCLCLLLMIPTVSRLFVQHAHFVKSANSKAKVLSQIIEQVPYFDANARLVLVTGMSIESLDERGVFELWTSMLDSAIYVLYQEARPKVAFLCVVGERCSTNDIKVAENELRPDADYSETVMFRLNEDLSVELLRDLPAELGTTQNKTYNPERLIDTSAPIPPRARMILGDLLPENSAEERD